MLAGDAGAVRRLACRDKERDWVPQAARHLVRDHGTREPAPEAAVAVVNGLRERRVLISATGFHANTLKIRPPLVFSESDASRLLTEMDAVFKTL